MNPVHKKLHRTQGKRNVEEVKGIAIMNKTMTLFPSKSLLGQFNKSAQVFSKFKTCHFSKNVSGSVTFLNPLTAIPNKNSSSLSKMIFSVSCAMCFQRQGQRSALNLWNKEGGSHGLWAYASLPGTEQALFLLPEELDLCFKQLNWVWSTELSISDCSCATPSLNLWKDGHQHYQPPILFLFRTFYTKYFVKF